MDDTTKYVSSSTSSKEPNKIANVADSIIQKSILAHGGKLYQNASYSFLFRKKDYTFTNGPSSYCYTAKGMVDGQEMIDTLKDGVFKRTVNGIEQQLSKKELETSKGVLNSVIYFATLPHKLNDSAVRASHKGSSVIKGNTYHVIEIRFAEENGGKDYNDIFYYWIDKQTNLIDYLAYRYHVNGGGIRFRTAYNRREVGGISFQDYINYKASMRNPLSELPALFEGGQLIEVSRIVTEEVVNLNSPNYQE